MEVGAVSAVIEELNVCMSAVRDLVGGYYRRQARKRSLRIELDRAAERVKHTAAAAARLDRLLVLEMAPVHFGVLRSAVTELQRRTVAVVVEAERYAPREPEVVRARRALDEVARRYAEGRISVESIVSVTAAALAEVEPPAGGPSPPTSAVAAAEEPQVSEAVYELCGVHTASSDTVHVGCCSALGRPDGDSERSDTAAAGDRGGLVTTAAACWGRTRSIASCVGDVVFSEISEAQRKLLQAALNALEEACRAIEAARRQVRVAPRRQKHYVRPPIFAKIVDFLYEDPTPIVVISGAPALGKSALAQEIKWLVDSQNQLAPRFDRSAYYLCKEGVCDNPAEMYRAVTEDSAAAEKSNFDIVEDLADHVGRSSMLLVLDNLEDSSCFHQHGPLRSLAQRLGTSKLVITTCNGKLCNVLPAACCFTLTRTENEDFVMFRLMSQLARGTGKRHDSLDVSPAVKGSIQSCVKQCQGSPQLLRLVDAYVRLTIMPPDHRATADTLSDAFAAQWRTCAEQLFPSAAAAQGEQANFAAYDRLNHHVYRRILRQVTTATDGTDTTGAATRTVNAALRAIIRLNSREWYAWEAVASFVASEETARSPRAGSRTPAASSAVASPLASPSGSAAASALTATPFNRSPLREGSAASDDSIGFLAWSNSLVGDAAARSPFVAQQDQRLLADVDKALQLLVSHRILEAQIRQAGRGAQAAVRLVRFHELLKECLTKCEEARSLVGLPSTPVDDDDGGESTRQYFLSQFGSMTPGNWLFKRAS